MLESDRQAPAWHALDAAGVAFRLGADVDKGLSAAEAERQLQRAGGNVLASEDEEPWWEELLESLREPLQLLLLAVAGLYFWLGETADALTILGVILIVVTIEVSSELRAKRAIASLSSLAASEATVLRDGQVTSIPARDLVTGDVALLAAGGRVPADLRLIETAALSVDESSLTGESVTVRKHATQRLAAAAELGDRVTMAYAGTLVTAGKARGLVVATGPETEIGRIAGLTRQAREPRTPLQLALGQLSRWLLWVAIAFSVLVPLLGIVLAGRPVREMLLTGLTLAFATIPEELPILITIVLGLGAYRLAKRKAIVKRLKAAETLGSVSVVATDKTGTLTENRMRLAAMHVGGSERMAADAAATPEGQHLLLVAMLANDAESQPDPKNAGREFLGDPTDVALMVAASDAGLDLHSVRQHHPLVVAYPFTDERKRMSVLVDVGGHRLLAMKGAPESVIGICAALRQQGNDEPLTEGVRVSLLERASEMADRGLRVLAVAERSGFDLAAGAPAAIDVERDLVLLGLVGLADPPRPEAMRAVSELRQAGVRVVMVTGDHPSTALAIARQVGIDQGEEPVRGRDLDAVTDQELLALVGRTSVFARATPEHKLRIVRALQAQGEVVAVTGDGVNDAPALKEAAIGVAMGGVGTDVAREAADLVIADDNLATLTEAVRTGRQLYANLRKAVRYYLAAKVALVSASLAAVLLKLPVPFEPVQIIVMELFMDLGASITFVAEPPENDVMRRPPRDPDHPFMDRSMRWGILAGGLSLGAAVLVGYLGAWHLGATQAQAQSAAFVAWMVGHVVLAAHMRSEQQPLVQGGLFSNLPFIFWTSAVASLLLIAQAVPSFQQRLHMEDLPTVAWLVALGGAILLPSWWEPWKLTRRAATPRRSPPIAN